MSYSFRNRPKLSDRYRGKSGDEILNELKSQLDEDRKMFFESSPGWNSVQSPGSFSRATNPLDDMMSRGRHDIRSHLDDLAQRHPEFADHLRCPPWGGEMGSSSHGTWGRKRRGSGSSGDDGCSPYNEPPQEPESSEEPSPSRGRPRQSNLPQYGLRNTVDLGQQQQQQQGDCEQDKGRGQRSWSAPPDNRSQNPPESPRYVSRLDIPVNPASSNVAPEQGKPPMAPKNNPQPQPQQQSHSTPKTTNQQGSTVRHIPIFVEGRDEPLLPKAADVPTEKIFTERTPPQSTFNYGRPSQFTGRHNQQQQQTSGPRVPQQSFAQNATSPNTKSHQPQATQQPSSQTKQEKKQKECQPNVAPSQPKQPVLNDPISRVQAIQKEVDELKVKVANYNGNSKDKDYLYLDEMLTRNLLKLDNIETEGKDDVRQARKAVIRDIQSCISNLESRVPSPEDVSQGSEVEVGQSCAESNVDARKSEVVSGAEGVECIDVSVEDEQKENSLKVAGELMDMPQTAENTDSSSTVLQLDLEMNSQPVSESSVNDSEQKGGSSSEVLQENLPPAEPVADVNPSERNQKLSISQPQEMQAEEIEVQPAGETMDVDSSSKISETVLRENNEEMSPTPHPEGEIPPLNIKLSSRKVKSPKGSPKKGKRTT